MHKSSCFCEDTAPPETSALPCLPVMKLEKACEAGQMPFIFHPQFQEKESTYVYGHSVFAPIPLAAIGSFQKRLLVFNQTGNHTQLLSCCPTPPLLPFAAVVKSVRPSDPSYAEKCFNINGFVPAKTLLQEESSENRGNAEETEEINALLYSDEEDDFGDSDDELTLLPPGQTQV